MGVAPPSVNTARAEDLTLNVRSRGPIRYTSWLCIPVELRCHATALIMVSCCPPAFFQTKAFEIRMDTFFHNFGLISPM